MPLMVQHPRGPRTEFRRQSEMETWERAVRDAQEKRAEVLLRMLDLVPREAQQTALQLALTLERQDADHSRFLSCVWSMSATQAYLEGQATPPSRAGRRWWQQAWRLLLFRS